jgi:cell division protein FtsL
MEAGAFAGLSGMLLLIVAVTWIALPFLVMGTNKRINIVNVNIRSLNENILMNQNKILEVQKDILACLQKMSGKPDAEAPNKLDTFPL